MARYNIANRMSKICSNMHVHWFFVYCMYTVKRRNDDVLDSVVVSRYIKNKYTYLLNGKESEVLCILQGALILALHFGMFSSFMARSRIRTYR